MRNTLLTSIIFALFSVQNVFACSCVTWNSFSENVKKSSSYVAHIAEFKVLSVSEHRLVAEVYKMWKGDLRIGQQIQIWDYSFKVSTSCGQPGAGVLTWQAGDSVVAGILLKNNPTYDYAYDTTGQMYIPSGPCGPWFLKIKGDTARGDVFGSTSSTTIESDVPYPVFSRRFPIYTGLVPLGIEADEASNFSMFPNPATSFVTLQGYKGSVNVYNMHHEKVAEGTGGLPLNLSGHPSGVYLLEFVHNDKRHYKKLVKE